MEKVKHKSAFAKRKLQEKIFFWLLISLPILQFIIFYIVVNFNSIILAFQKIEITSDGKNVYTWVGFENFKDNFRLLFTEYSLLQSFKNSFLVYFIGLVFGTGGALLFSYYIYKKKWFSSFFKVTLFLPSIISAVTMVIVFKYFVESAYPVLVEKIFKLEVEGLLANPKTAFGTIVFYGIWSGFGGSILMYVSAMNSIPESVVEAAKLDGITSIKEFFMITIPLIWPTLVVFLSTGLVGIFTNQISLYTFYGDQASMAYYTYGYYLFVHTTKGLAYYPRMASLGLIFTIIVAPLTFLVRKLLEKYGPRTE